jgi:hypothetical protein
MFHVGLFLNPKRERGIPYHSLTLRVVTEPLPAANPLNLQPPSRRRFRGVRGSILAIDSSGYLDFRVVFSGLPFRVLALGGRIPYHCRRGLRKMNGSGGLCGSLDSSFFLVVPLGTWLTQ